MKGWEELAQSAAQALTTAVHNENEAVPAAVVMRRMREFRARSGDVSDVDRGRHAAYAEVLAQGVKALRLVERSRRIMEVTGDAEDDAGVVSAGLMIGRRTLACVTRALDALLAGRRDEQAEAAARRLEQALLPAMARVNHVYKFAVKEGIIATQDDDARAGK